MNSQTSRPTIGFIHQVMFNDQPINLFKGVADVAREQEMNLLCFVGGAFHHPDRFFWLQGSIIYELRQARVDGVIISSALIGAFTEFAEIERFCRRYLPSPIVSLGLALEGIPSVTLDNYPGMYAAVSHLIEAHGYRRIAFIRGPVNNVEAEARYCAYCDALQAHGIAVAPELVAPGNFTMSYGHEAIRAWFDDKGFRPGREIEAIAAANDLVALGAFQALQRRGIYVPQQIGLAGFDDMRWGEERNPFLTTVRQPFYEMGRRAAELLCAQLRGEPCPPQVVMPAQPVIRQSCGCLSPSVIHAMTSPALTQRPFDLSVAPDRAALIAEMAQAVGGRPQDEAQAREFLENFAAYLRDDAPEKFLQGLILILNHAEANGGEVALWQNALSVARRALFPALAGDDLRRAEDLWQQARIVIGESVAQRQALTGFRAYNSAFGLRAFRTFVMASENLEALLRSLSEELPRQGIKAFCLALYEQAQPYQYPQPAPEWSRLILAQDEQGRRPLPPEGLRFRSDLVLPNGFWPQKEAWQLIIIPLYFQEIQLGFIVLAPHRWDHLRYESLRIDIGMALRVVLLLEENRRHQAELERLVQELQDTLDRLQRMQSELIHAEKMAALGKLIANVAHEINTPIGAIRASAGNILIALEQTLRILPEAFRAVSDDRQAAFIALVRRACQPKTPLTSREERQRKRGLTQKLEARGVSDADALADTLADMGIYDDVEDVCAMTQDQQAAMLLSAAANLASQRHNSDNIVAAVERVSKIVFALKSYAHSEASGQPTVARIQDGMDVVLTLYHNQLKHGIEVVKRYDDAPPILCYPDELQQVWTNLIHNAIHAMQGKGRLEIAVKPTPLPSEEGKLSTPLLGGAGGGSGILIEITDSGCGIPPEITDRIFEPFFTTKPAGEGSGMGLDICKKIVDKHHGAIEVESQPGRTTFRVFLSIP